MANQSSVRDSYHMCFVKRMLATECSEVSDRAEDASLRVNEPIICLSVRTLANAVPMCPPFVRFQLALALSQSDHRRVIEVVLPTELAEIRDRHLFTIWINKSTPRFSELVAWRASDWIYVEADSTVSAIGAVEPRLLDSQQLRTIYDFEDRERETILSIEIPRCL